jgi:Cu/Ag efflux pump CusA
MPLIKLEYDNSKVSKEEAQILSEAIQRIVSEVTEIEDVFVYGNSAEIKVKIAPIEIFVEMSDYKIKDKEELINTFKEHLSKWKIENSYAHPINLTLIPMPWKVEVGI